jgi:hypothetical protein
MAKALAILAALYFSLMLSAGVGHAQSKTGASRITVYEESG